MWRKRGDPSVEAGRMDAASPVAEPSPGHHSRRKPVVLKDPNRSRMRAAEIVGGKTAECAAIFCCFPFGLASLFIFAAVRLPAGLCRQALRKRSIRREKKKAELLGSGSESGSGSWSGSSKAGSRSDDEFTEFADMRGGVMMVFGDRWPARSPTAEVMELEKEMSKFYCSGFWRSLSEKDLINCVAK